MTLEQLKSYLKDIFFNKKEPELPIGKLNPKQVFMVKMTMKDEIKEQMGDDLYHIGENIVVKKKGWELYQKLSKRKNESGRT